MKYLTFLSLVYCIFLLACTPEIGQPSYTGETDPFVKKAFNQNVAHSKAGFSKSYRAYQAVYREPDPLFQQGQNLIRNGDKTQWMELSDKVKPFVEELNSKGKSMEVQLLCLIIIDKVLMPNAARESIARNNDYYQQLKYFYEMLVDNKGVDLDIMANAFLLLKDKLSPLEVSRYSSYLIESAKKDLVLSEEQLGRIQNDDLSFGEVSKRYYEQVKAEAEYVLSKLNEGK